jgi:hypothetical protein
MCSAAPASDADQKFDHALRDKVKQGGSHDRLRVIVSTRPGARGKVARRLAVEGAKVNGQYALTDAVVATLSEGAGPQARQGR